MLQFLTFYYWEQAQLLLEAQLDLLNTKKLKYYQTISFVHYLQLGSQRNAIASEQYFNSIIASGLFYGLEKEFQAIPFVVPKAGSGLRNYMYLSYPLRLLYCAVGLYLVDLFEEFQTEYVRQNKHIRAFYGGNVRFSNKAILTKSEHLTYYQHYDKFKEEIRSFISQNKSNGVVLKLDVQNYYDNLSVPRLLLLLQEAIKPAIQQRHNFTSATISELTEFYNYVSKGKGGIPQCDNDVVSGFIGHAYLIFGDLLIEDALKEISAKLESYSIIRYVDDIYIIMNFKTVVTLSEKRSMVHLLLEKIVERFNSKLALKFNSKTEIFNIVEPSHRAKLLASLKKISFQTKPSTAAPNRNLTQGQLSFNKILLELEKIKNYDRLDDSASEAQKLDSELLKDIYSKQVAHTLKKDENRHSLESLFETFDFEIVKLAPRELLLLIFSSRLLTERFTDHLLARPTLTIKDINLALWSICIAGSISPNDKFLQKLASQENMAPLIEALTSSEVAHQMPGYFGLTRSDCTRIGNMNRNIVTQIYLRVKNENSKAYSVALNHLVNEFQSIAHDVIRPSGILLKDFDANQVVIHLRSAGVTHEYCIAMRNLFNRRNSNQVSHAGGGDSVAWSVTTAEYQSYKRQVGSCLEELLTNLPALRGRI